VRFQTHSDRLDGVATRLKIEPMEVIKRLCGVEVRLGGEGPQGWLPPGAVPPPPMPVRVVRLDLEIVDEGDGFLLAWTGPSELASNDMWHGSVEGAMEDARLRFGIDPSEWMPPGPAL
jgi:hypothetical protein